jgi:EAL and modified HD-GYP domain-containing signal transduction protein
VREALLERRGPCADALELAELYERGAWREMAAAAAHVGIPTPRVAQMYTDALGWTRERLARWERATG